ncbi:hypothetical protein EYF80_063524 [Liparis tanakae]|uniref:Uncharacterized protein n=1 Tax=Liparis tanakae TaxID=230148 RepID=A0A4Z2EBZ8_9TELE|nr:hypothetical protein EYF80_063524 [Liparis tanakae]
MWGHVRSCGVMCLLQGFPVMNRGAPLLLNLQPGQTVQPLTLIQSPSLGQLIRPSVGVSQGQVVQTRLGPAPSRGSAFTAMQLPATLSFRPDTPGPVNLQATQVGGASALKLAVSPALPSGSANGVTGIFSSGTRQLVGGANEDHLLTRGPNAHLCPAAPGPAPSPPPLPTSAPPRVVMTVEEFYYGTSEGDPALRKPLPLGTKTSTFTCQVCPYLAENNLRWVPEHRGARRPRGP